MTVAATCKRKRKQAVNGYKHLGPKKRDVYTSAKRLQERIAKEQAMRGRKKV